MDRTLHYLLMSDHLILQRLLTNSIKDTELTSGQPKVLDYLYSHDGAIQKDIAQSCCIEQATLTSVLAGMENKGLIKRRTMNDNRRNLYVFLTDKGKMLTQRVEQEFSGLEKLAFSGFNKQEQELVISFLSRIRDNFVHIKEESNHE